MLKSLGVFQNSLNMRMNLSFLKKPLITVPSFNFSGNPIYKNEIMKKRNRKYIVEKEKEKTRIGLKVQLEKEIERKYADQFNVIGKEKTNESENHFESYYVPLKDEDHYYLHFFEEKLRQDINKGGRIMLTNEIKAYNDNLAANADSKLQFEFEPLSEADIVELRRDFKYILSNSDAFTFILQEGKSFYNYMKEQNELASIEHEKVYEELLSINHFYRIHDKFPFNTKISVDFEKFKVNIS